MKVLPDDQLFPAFRRTAIRLEREGFEWDREKLPLDLRRSWGETAYMVNEAEGRLARIDIKTGAVVRTYAAAYFDEFRRLREAGYSVNVQRMPENMFPNRDAGPCAYMIAPAPDNTVVRIDKDTGAVTVHATMLDLERLAAGRPSLVTGPL